MKIAVLSDIHGNLAAFQAVAADIAAWQADQVVLAGDIVNRGPLPRQCWEFAQELRHTAGWIILRGNHEEYVVNVAADPSPAQGVEEAVRASVRWTWQQIGDVAPLAALPTEHRVFGGSSNELRIVHASMRHNRDNILVDTPDDELRQQIAPAPAVFCGGHTHRPFIRTVDSTLVVNTGSVGLPFDGDRRACYVRLQYQNGNWRAELVRLTYDYARAEKDYVHGGFLESSPIGPLILHECQVARPQLATWYRTYHDQVQAGELSAADSVQAFLAQ